MSNVVNWTKVVIRQQTALTGDLMVYGIRNQIPKLVGFGIDIAFEFRKNRVTAFISEDSKQQLITYVRDKINEDQKFLKKQLGLGHRRLNHLLKVSREINQAVKSEKFKALDCLSSYLSAFYSYTPFLFSVFPIEVLLTRQLTDQLNRYFPGETKTQIENHFRLLTTIDESSDYYLEQTELLQLVVDRQRGKDIKQALKHHAKRFGYMGLTNSLLSQPYDASYFATLLKGIDDPQSQLTKLQLERKQKQAEYRQFI